MAASSAASATTGEDGRAGEYAPLLGGLTSSPSHTSTPPDSPSLVPLTRSPDQSPRCGGSSSMKSFTAVAEMTVHHQYEEDEGVEDGSKGSEGCRCCDLLVVAASTASTDSPSISTQNCTCYIENSNSSSTSLSKHSDQHRKSDTFCTTRPHDGRPPPLLNSHHSSEIQESSHQRTKKSSSSSCSSISTAENPHGSRNVSHEVDGSDDSSSNDIEEDSLGSGGCAGPSSYKNSLYKEGASYRDLTSQDSSCVNEVDFPSKVTFVIDGTEGEEEEELDNGFSVIQPVKVSRLKSSCLGDRIPSYTLPSTLSTTSSTTSMPFCRICHHPEGDGVESLISPCRCAGTMKFIHQGCLMKWLEVSGIRSRQVPTCELCNYQFQRRKKFRIRQCQMPSCSSRDKLLHCIFLVCLFVMLACAAVTVVCFRQNSNPRLNRKDTELSKSEVVTLTCGVLFFVAFFVAMYVEVKATDTLYRLCSSFIYMNQTIHIYEYDKRKDDQQTRSPV